MKFRYNVFNLITAILFVLAFFTLMFSYITSFMFYPATLFFAAAFVMLSIRLIKNYVKNSNVDDLSEETIVMELSGDANAETYVMQDETTNKKAKRKMRAQKFDRLLPSIFSIMGAVLFVFLFINRIIHH